MAWGVLDPGQDRVRPAIQERSCRATGAGQCIESEVTIRPGERREGPIDLLGMLDGPQGPGPGGPLPLDRILCARSRDEEGCSEEFGGHGADHERVFCAGPSSSMRSEATTARCPSLSAARSPASPWT